MSILKKKLNTAAVKIHQNCILAQSRTPCIELYAKYNWQSMLL